MIPDEFVRWWMEHNRISHVHKVLEDSFNAAGYMNLEAEVDVQMVYRDSYPPYSNEYQLHWSIASYLADIVAQYKKSQQTT